MDVFDKEKRSAVMARVRDRDTKPELAVRRYLHVCGLRFRLHRNDLPGRPDLVFPGRRIVVFVHGCFWHQHPGCGKAKLPKTRSEFWREKLEGNARRDERVLRELSALGWTSHVIWECEITDSGLERLEAAIRAGDR